MQGLNLGRSLLNELRFKLSMANFIEIEGCQKWADDTPKKSKMVLFANVDCCWSYIYGIEDTVKTRDKLMLNQILQKTYRHTHAHCSFHERKGMATHNIYRYILVRHPCSQINMLEKICMRVHIYTFMSPSLKTYFTDGHRFQPWEHWAWHVAFNIVLPGMAVTGYIVVD